jgi:hypothetical protein
MWLQTPLRILEFLANATAPGLAITGGGEKRLIGYHGHRYMHMLLPADQSRLGCR